MRLRVLAGVAAVVVGILLGACILAVFVAVAATLDGVLP